MAVVFIVIVQIAVVLIAVVEKFALKSFLNLCFKYIVKSSKPF